MATIEQPEPVVAAPPEALAARRALLHAHAIDLGSLPPEQLGIAFSGGGIRSATISLGVAQALAAKDRLLDFDYMSTVSGGGYFGSFLRSLFLPQSARGSDGKIDPAGAAKADTEFALEVLKSEPNVVTLRNGMINPIRWLRENSRYLAPSGPTDYAVAATYIVRNWLAMLFVFALPTLLFFLAVHALVHRLGPRLHFPGVSARDGSWTAAGLSIILVLPLLLVVVSIIVGVANWLTVYAADRWTAAKGAGTTLEPALRVLATAAVALVSGVILILLLAASWNGAVLHPPDWQPHAGMHDLIAGLWGLETADSILVTVAATLACGAILAALVTTMGIIRMETREPRIGDALFGNELRRLLTSWNEKINMAMVFLLLLAAIDSAALFLVRMGAPAASALAWTSVIAPLGRMLIQKLQSSFGKSTPSGPFTAFLARYMWQVAFVAAALLWGGFAVLLDVLAREVTYWPAQWPQASSLALGVVAVMTVMIGWSVQFINLSSLHSLYAARLTRAYLGASNQARLAKPDLLDITGYQAKDVILADVYQQQICAAPLHLMNVTLNETISATGSQLLARDRKGIPMVIAPEGIWIDAAETRRTQPDCSWTGFAQSKAESFSVGQITAISGAAASSAMGSRTTLGGALLFTYANIRLGYWWKRGTVGNDPDPAKTRGPYDWLKWTGTFGYLFREMTARYRSTTKRVNLSDGGHFEDSGVYELLRRKVKTIVYCDNGEDVGYHFEDLEILVREARLDIGAGIEVASPAEVLVAVSDEGARLFLNGRPGDWRARARSRDPDDPAFALLLKVLDAGCRKIGTIVLLKPSLFETLPADVWGYAEAHPDFPHESTADQFFTEAQWESYRKLGFMMMEQLLIGTAHRADLFREL